MNRGSLVCQVCSGHAPFWVLLLIILAIVALGFTSGYLWHRNGGRR